MKKRQQGFTLLEVMVVLIVDACRNHLNRACNEQPHCRQCRR
ncbi:prepilin-type N-terminal cleavage/methylation domain-containing protein [Xylella fastidiosa]|nr:prepilin-type N-terminal cleavage/methylation domain-containing protein [Xylella fastidiosa]MCP8325247.1 prepilin-type N-terminal cleavage/methylation domain-containing protein [Xylella fastidiosa subsp. multiplex]MDD0943222.1 prepilin-type N-terminal cleavage/methylation domain-containing protein [Xylella fastidiosa subsp. multiplex]